MLLPDYKLVGVPGKFRNGHRKKAKCFAQKYRLLAEVPRKVRSVSLATTDLTTARRRATRYVEDAIRKHLIASNPEARTASRGIVAVLKEYLDDLPPLGNSEKQIAMVKTRLGSILSRPS